MTSQTLYDILGVLEDASPAEIKAAYRRKMGHIHPDRGGSEDAARQVNAAYDVLSDEQRRAEYDANRRGGVALCPLCDDPQHSDDELVGHLIRHRAEIEAAQAVVTRETVSQAAQPSQAEETPEFEGAARSTGGSESGGKSQAATRNRPWRWARIADFTSRTRRSEFWTAAGAGLAATFGTGVLDGIVFPAEPGFLYLIGMAIWFWLFWGSSVNRLHDMGRSGWISLAYFFPLVNVGILIWIGSTAGESTPNRWGLPIGVVDDTPEDSPTSDPIEDLTAAASTSRTDRHLSPSVQWLIVIAVIAFLAVAVLVPVALNRSSSDEQSSAGPLETQSSTVTQASVVEVTVTTRANTTTTTFQYIESAGGTWSLPDHSEHAVPIGGAVSPALPGSRAEWFADYDSPDDTTLELKYLLFDGEVKYDVVDRVCLTSACDTYLVYMADDLQSVWVVDGEKADGGIELSDSLHFLSPAIGSVAVCRAGAFDGPVVAIKTGSADSPSIGDAWVFIGDATNGSWFGFDPSLIDPGSFLPPPFSDNEIPDCRPSDYAEEVEALVDRVSESEASDLLFGPSANWTDAKGMVSDSLIDASISWADLSLMVDGELAGLDVLTGGCVHADCTTSLTMAVADGNWDREVWWFFDDEGASQALGFELTESEGNGYYCWSERYGLPVVYTVGPSPALEAVRAWIFDTDRKWYPAEIDAIQPTSERYSDGDFSRC